MLRCTTAAVAEPFGEPVVERGGAGAWKMVAPTALSSSAV